METLVQIPTSNLNICVVGAVSAGKSTFLNACFLKHLSPGSIKRTTMVPVVYVESEDEGTPERQVFETVSTKNQELIEKSERGIVHAADYTELVFKVGPLNIDIAKCKFNMYDIPGLNDARTKAVYYKYLESNFSKFNIVLLLVDLQSGMNTSDEMDIVRFIVEQTLRNKERNIHTLVIANKADDMQLDAATGTLTFEGELQSMFDQVEKTVTGAFAQAGISEKLIGVAPVSAIDAYLYRMILKHKEGFVLSPEQILKIGINDQGKKFSKLGRQDQEERVRSIVQNETFLSDMVQLSGFAGVVRMLRHYLKDNYKDAQVANIMASLQEYDVEAELRLYQPDYFKPLFDQKKTLKTVEARLKKYRQELYPIDKKLYKKEMNSLFQTLYQKRFSGKVAAPTIEVHCTYPTLHFDCLRSYIVETWPGDFDFGDDDFFSTEEARTRYPECVKEEVMHNLQGLVGADQLCAMGIMKTVGMLTRENVLKYAQETLCKGHFHFYTINYQHGSVDLSTKPNPLKALETLKIVKDVLGNEDEMRDITLRVWAQYFLADGVTENCRVGPDEQYLRNVLHAKFNISETKYLLTTFPFPRTGVCEYYKFVRPEALRDDPRFALDFFLIDLFLEA